MLDAEISRLVVVAVFQKQRETAKSLIYHAG